MISVSDAFVACTVINFIVMIPPLCCTHARVFDCVDFVSFAPHIVGTLYWFSIASDELHDCNCFQVISGVLRKTVFFRFSSFSIIPKLNGHTTIAGRNWINVVVAGDGRWCSLYAFLRITGLVLARDWNCVRMHMAQSLCASQQSLLRSLPHLQQGRMNSV